MSILENNSLETFRKAECDEIERLFMASNPWFVDHELVIAIYQRIYHRTLSNQFGLSGCYLYGFINGVRAERKRRKEKQKKSKKSYTTIMRKYDYSAILSREVKKHE